MLLRSAAIRGLSTNLSLKASRANFGEPRVQEPFSASVTPFNEAYLMTNAQLQRASVSRLGVAYTQAQSRLEHAATLNSRKFTVANAPHIFATQTTTALLDALRDFRNEPAWAQIEFRYRRVIAGLARRLGAGETDALDISQQTLAEFVRAYKDGRYDRTKGRLSSWILGIAHNTTLRVLRNQRRGGRVSDFETSEASGEVHDPHLRSIWDDERDREILDKAMTLLRDEASLDDRTLLAFELVALRSVPTAEAASQCGMTVEQIYVAKSRVTKHLRMLVAQLTEAFEQDA